MSLQTSTISVVIPIYNSSKSILLLYTRVARVLGELHPQEKKADEILLIDDFSQDQSFAVISWLAARDPRVKVVKLKKNLGQHEAIAIGLSLATGSFVVVMDDDLQDPPEEIHKLYSAIVDVDGCDAVFGQRKDRRGSWPQKISSLLFHRSLKVLFQYQSDPTIACFCILSRRAVQLLNQSDHCMKFCFYKVKTLVPNTKKLQVAHHQGQRGLGHSSYTTITRTVLAIKILGLAMLRKSYKKKRLNLDVYVEKKINF
ncbi:MAG: glycosyltransferase family 2 protein [Oligoflexia bacterium]|nr:glycosyltransferase family 2 protein [Oligoflexia bacterium]